MHRPAALFAWNFKFLKTVRSIYSEKKSKIILIIHKRLERRRVYVFVYGASDLDYKVDKNKSATGQVPGTRQRLSKWQTC